MTTWNGTRLLGPSAKWRQHSSNEL